MNIGNHQEDKIITKELKINKNVFIFNETVLPLNNISQISVSSARRKKYNVLYFIMIFAGCVFFVDSILLKLIGLFLFAGGIYLIRNVYQYARDCVKNKDKDSFIKLLKRNREELFINVLSGVVSGGLQAVLMGLIGQ